MTRLLSACLVLACGTSPGIAQAPGHRLVSPISGTDTLLFDARGVLVHTWPGEHKPGMAVYMKADGNLLRSVVTQEGPSGTGGGVQERAIDGELLWDYRLDSDELLAHHDIEPLPNGNVLMLVWENLSREEARAAGRDPQRISGLVRSERIVEVRPTGQRSGEIVWSWRALEQAEIDINYPPERSAGELNHINGIDYDPANDWIVVSASFQDELWVIDRSTGDLVARFGNPAAGGQGDEDQRSIYFPHAPRFVPGGGRWPHLFVFNNRSRPRSEVLEVALWDPTSPVRRLLPEPRVVWSYRAAGFDSDFMGSAERLPGGNTLICSSMQLRIFEVDPAGDVVFELGKDELSSFPFHATYVERTLWADRTRPSLELQDVSFHVIAGSRHAQECYALFEGPMAPLWPWEGAFLGGGVLDAHGKARLALERRGELSAPAALGWLGLERRFMYLSFDAVLRKGTNPPNAVVLKPTL